MHAAGAIPSVRAARSGAHRVAGLAAALVLAALAPSCWRSHTRELEDACRRANAHEVALGSPWEGAWADAVCGAHARIAERTGCVEEDRAFFDCRLARTELDGAACAGAFDAFVRCVEDAEVEPCVTTCEARQRAGCPESPACGISCLVIEASGVLGSCEGDVAALHACEAARADLCDEGCTTEHDALGACTRPLCAAEPAVCAACAPDCGP